MTNDEATNDESNLNVEGSNDETLAVLGDFDCAFGNAWVGER